MKIMNRVKGGDPQEVDLPPGHPLELIAEFYESRRIEIDVPGGKVEITIPYQEGVSWG